MVQELIIKSDSCETESLHQIQILGVTVHVKTNDHLGEGGNVWTAVQELAALLAESEIDFKTKRILELGGGPGALSLALAMRGAYVTCTDAPWVTGLTRQNAASDLNKGLIEAAGGTISVVDYIWGRESQSPVDKTPDIILACECVYQLTSGGLHEIFGLDTAPTGGPLLESIRRLCGPETTLFLANR